MVTSDTDNPGKLVAEGFPHSTDVPGTAASIQCWNGVQVACEEDSNVSLLQSQAGQNFLGESTGQGLAQQPRHAIGSVPKALATLKICGSDNCAHAVRQTVDNRVQDRQAIIVESSRPAACVKERDFGDRL
jgi:hypothetical protein